MERKFADRKFLFGTKVFAFQKVQRKRERTIRKIFPTMNEIDQLIERVTNKKWELVLFVGYALDVSKVWRLFVAV